MGLTNAVLSDWVNQIFNNGTPTAYPALYLSLHSGNPGSNGANELSGNGYTRQNITTLFDDATAGIVGNNGVITFGPASGSPWAAATYFGFWTASSGGTFIGGFPLTNSQTVTVPNTASFAIGALTFQVTS